MGFHKSIKNPWIVFPAALIVFVLVAVNVLIFTKGSLAKESKSSAASNRSSVVSYMDAVDLCVQKTRKDLGSKYLRHQLSDRSSYFDESSEKYRIALNVDKGTYASHESITTHCVVPYRRFAVTDFEELDKDGGSGGSASAIASSFNKRSKNSSDDE